jgi:transposase
MEGRSLYERLLGISSPWFVSSVVFDEGSLSVLVGVEMVAGTTLHCPVCAAACSGYDLREQRRWRHLDSCGFQTYLLANIPRVSCPEHGIVSVSVPWSEPNSRFTLDFERFAILVLGQTKSQTRTGRILKLSQGQVHDIMHRAVRRGLARRKETEICRLSIDEKSFLRGHHYVSVLSDLAQRRVIDVCEDRTIDGVSKLLETSLSEKLREKVLCAVMDMWEGFIRATRRVLPKADIVFDRFHIAKYLNDAVDKTRIAEHRKLLKSGDDSLKGSKQFWGYRKDNLSEKQNAKYGHLLDMNLETSKVWALKETFRGFFELSDIQEGREFFENWDADVQELGNRHLRKVAKTLRHYYHGLEAYLKHKSTNATAEGLNAMIQEIKTVARGFRTFEAFRIAILFFLGKLELNPLKTR